MPNNNPLPVSLQQECRKAQKIFSSFVDPVNGLDHIVPPSILRRAKGFAFITIVKAGFVFSARAGTGIVIARLKDGSWSAPSAIGTAGLGAGFQAGAEMTDFMIILNSSAAVKSFMAKGSLTVGGNMSISAGPLGRNVEGTGSLSSKARVSLMYSYSRSRGLFGGASIEGSIIVERQDANVKAYGYSVSSTQLLSGAVDCPAWAQGLVDVIKRRSGRDNRIEGWIEDGDEIEGHEGGGGRGYGRLGNGRRRDGYDDDDLDDDSVQGYDPFGSDDERGGRDESGRCTGEKRQTFKDDGLTPREYEERGYAFGSQYASGGSHVSNARSPGGGRGGVVGRDRAESTGSGRGAIANGWSPTRDRGGFAGKVLGTIGGGRSRSGSGASNSISGSAAAGGGGPSKWGTGIESPRDGGQGVGPVQGANVNFAEKFESDFDFDEEHRKERDRTAGLRDGRATSSPLRSPATTRPNLTLVDAEDPFAEPSSGDFGTSPSAFDGSSTAASPTTGRLSRPSLFSRKSSSSKLVKGRSSRSGSGTGSALRERAGQMNWDTFGREGDENEQRGGGGGGGFRDPSRDSFDSLEDEDNEYSLTTAGRKRASTVSGAGTSNPDDILSSYHRGPLPPSSSSRLGPGGRPRASTSPFSTSSTTTSPTTGSRFSFTRKKSNSTSSSSSPSFGFDRARDRAPEGGGARLYPIRSNDSYGTSSVDEGDFENRRRRGGGEGGTRRGPKSWDAEDDDLFTSPPAGRPTRTSDTGTGPSDPSANELSARARSLTLTPGSSRERSGTVTNDKIGLGRAVALYDFKGVESTDLPFFKNDVLTILATDDEEWYKARKGVREGLIPRNYVEIEWF
ncbi:hypothetical protein JCM10212_005049 [Sporobolomyces blumeae]